MFLSASAHGETRRVGHSRRLMPRHYFLPSFPVIPPMMMPTVDDAIRGGIGQPKEYAYAAEDFRLFLPPSLSPPSSRLNNNDNSPSRQPHQQQQHLQSSSLLFSCPLPTSIDYARLYSLLSEFAAHNAGSLIIPTSHPTSHRIADILSSTGVERLLDARWNAQLEKVAIMMRHHGTKITAAQYGGGTATTHRYEEEEYDSLTTLTTDWIHEQRTQYHRHQQNLPNSLSSIRYHQLQTKLPQLFFPSNSHNSSNSSSISYGSGSTANTNSAEVVETTQQQHPTNHSINGSKWEARLHELIQYQSLHGHTDVPLDHPTLLGIWVKNQRDTYFYQRSSMVPSRIAALDAIHFDWNNRWGHQRLQVRQDAWENMYTKLVEYMKKHGHGNVSQHAGKKKRKTKKKNKPNTGGGGEECGGGGDDGDEGNEDFDEENEEGEEEERLGKWIKNQRYEYRKYHVKELGPSRLGRDRIEKLNAIGFQWRLRPERVKWEDRFEALVEFKQTYGHCRVPMSIPDLGKWAKYQRDQYVLYLRGKPSKMTSNKIDKLVSIGFEDSIDDKAAAAIAANSSGLSINNDCDACGSGGEGGEEYEVDGDDKEEEDATSEYAVRMDDVIVYHHHLQQQQQQQQQQQLPFLDNSHAFHSPQQQQFPLPGSIGNINYTSCSDGGSTIAHHKY